MADITDTIFFSVLLSSVMIGFIFIIQNRLFTYLNSLPFFLLYLYGIERWGEYLSSHGKHNTWLYNYSSVVEFAYYLWFISKMYFLKNKAKLIYIIATVYCIIALLNIIFFQGKTGFHSITYGIGSILVITACVYYFYQLLLFPNEEKLIKQPQFWICASMLFSFGCGFPLFCLNNFYGDRISEKIWPIITAINNIINIVYYLLFIVAFLCKIKLKKYLPSLF